MGTCHSICMRTDRQRDTSAVVMQQYFVVVVDDVDRVVHGQRNYDPKIMF